MKIIVDKLPKTPQDCLFGWKHIEYHRQRCRFGGECEMYSGRRQCSYLQEAGADINAGAERPAAGTDGKNELHGAGKETDTLP